MLSQLNTWNKIGRIITRLSERLDISIERSIDLFYTSKTCKEFHDPKSGLYLLGDNYIVDELMIELSKR